MTDRRYREGHPLAMGAVMVVAATIGIVKLWSATGWWVLLALAVMGFVLGRGLYRIACEIAKPCRPVEPDPPAAVDEVPPVRALRNPRGPKGAA